MHRIDEGRTVKVIGKVGEKYESIAALNCKESKESVHNVAVHEMWQRNNWLN